MTLCFKVRVDPPKLQALEGWSRPKNIRYYYIEPSFDVPDEVNVLFTWMLEGPGVLTHT